MLALDLQKAENLIRWKITVLQQTLKVIMTAPSNVHDAEILFWPKKNIHSTNSTPVCGVL